MLFIRLLVIPFLFWPFAGFTASQPSNVEGKISDAESFCNKKVNQPICDNKAKATQWPTTAFKNGIPFQLGVFKFKLPKKYIERSEYYSNSKKSNPSAKNFSLILSENEGFTLSIKSPPPNVNAYNLFYRIFMNSVKTQPFMSLSNHKKMQVIEAKSHILSKGNAKVISYSKGDFNTFKVIYTNIANYSMTYITHKQLQDQFLIIDNTLLTPSELDKFIASIELAL